jgi:hypothetical protein
MICMYVCVCLYIYIYILRCRRVLVFAIHSHLASLVLAMPLSACVG